MQVDSGRDSDLTTCAESDDSGGAHSKGSKQRPSWGRKGSHNWKGHGGSSSSNWKGNQEHRGSTSSSDEKWGSSGNWGWNTAGNWNAWRNNSWGSDWGEGNNWSRRDSWDRRDSNAKKGYASSSGHKGFDKKGSYKRRREWVNLSVSQLGIGAVPQNAGEQFPLDSATEEAGIGRKRDSATSSQDTTLESTTLSSGISSEASAALEFRDDLCMFAWDVLRANLKAKENARRGTDCNSQAWPSFSCGFAGSSAVTPEYPDFPTGYAEGLECPLFVTWSKGDVLRGCIGCMEPLVLSTGLKDYTLKSALHDSRFPSISTQELDALTCQVSVLHSFEERGSNLYDWVFGLHGILIAFEVDGKGGKFSATYLPEVPEEAGFGTREATIKELVRKAGFYGDVDRDLRNVKLTRYQSTRVKIDAEEYKRRKGISFGDVV